jgi:glycolate oxidase subunit GlcD
MRNSPFIAELESICGKERVLQSPSQLLAYESDGLSFLRHRPDVVAIPADSEELRQVMDAARFHKIPYVIRGAGTGLSGACVADQGGLMIHLSRLKKILEIRPEDLCCVVEPGVVLNALNDALEPHGLFYPPDPSSGFACTLGGNVATNAGGIRCFKYGVTSNYVLGLEMVSPEGELLRFGSPEGPLEGPDWRALMVGSEGLLGAITKIWLRLKPLPGSPCTFLVSFQELDQAASAVNELVHHPCIPVAIELLDQNTVRLVEASPMRVGLPKDSWVLLVEINGPKELVDVQAPGIEALLRRHQALSIEKTFDEKERLRLWKARKAAGGLVGQVSPDVMIQDAVIPRSRIAEVLKEIYAEAKRQDLPVINVFHAGDGNLHPNFMFDSRDEGQLKRVKEAGKHLMEAVIRVGGTLSGEHGIGSDKMDYLGLVFGPREMEAQKTVISLFNPRNQLNPGKVLAGRDFHADL